MDTLENRKKKYFTQIENCVLKNYKISIQARLLYAILESYSFEGITTIFPTQDRLGLELGISVRSVQRYLNELEAWELIKIEQRGLRKSNNYIIYRIPTSIKDEYFKNEIGIRAIASEKREIWALEEGEEKLEKLKKINQKIAGVKRVKKIERAKLLKSVKSEADTTTMSYQEATPVSY